MRKIAHKTIALLLCLSLLLTGCSNKKIYFSTGLTNNEIFKINGSACTKPEAMLFLTTMKNTYESSFGQEMWEKKFGDTTLQEYVKSIVKNQLAQMKCLNLLAKKKKITLTEAEKEKVKQVAQIYYSGLNQDEITYMGITQDTVEKVYTQYALAEKVYNELTQGINTEISDADARVIKVQQIFIKTYRMDDNNNKVEFSEEEKADALTRIQSIQQSVNSGEDFYSLAEKYNEDTQIEYQFGKGEMVEAFENAAFALTDGQVSDIVETDTGYHIIKCMEDYMVDETEANKVKLLDKEKEDAFQKIYDPFVEDLTSEFNDKVWDNISFQSNENVKTSNFYEVYEANY